MSRIINKQKIILIFFLFSIHSAFAFVPGADRYEISIGGDVPFYTGLQGRYNWSTQYYTKVGAGFALELFMDLHQDMLSTLNLSKNSRTLVSALVNSVIFDARLGWAMSIYEGPYLELGYSLMIWGKGEVMGANLKSTSKVDNLSDTSIYKVNILNHGPTFHIGYRFILIDKLTLNIDVGVYKPLFSHAKLNYGDILVPSGETEKINTLLVREIWFLSGGLWFGLSF